MNARSDAIYVVEWHNKEARGWYDIIPASVLKAGRAQRSLSHELVSSKGEVIVATFDIEPTDEGKLLLRYGGRNAEANRAEGVFLGDMCIDPKSFAKATQLYWKDEGKKPVRIRVTVWSTKLEGTRITRATSSLRRSRRLKAFKQAIGRRAGICEACGYKGHPGYGDAKYACFDVHHSRPLAKGERPNGLNDLVYICANCHKAITAIGNIPFDRFVKQLKRASGQ